MAKKDAKATPGSSKDVPKAVPGRPPYEPTGQDRAIVDRMASYGERQENIARIIGIDAKTLRKHFREELDTAAIKANAQVTMTLFDKCVGRAAVYDAQGRLLKREIIPDTGAIAWWQKNRMKWSEREHVEVRGDALKTDVRITLQALDPDQRLTLRKLLESASEKQKVIDGEAVEVE